MVAERQAYMFPVRRPSGTYAAGYTQFQIDVLPASEIVSQESTCTSH
jgi:hypothetical protein